MARSHGLLAFLGVLSFSSFPLRSLCQVGGLFDIPPPPPPPTLSNPVASQVESNDFKRMLLRKSNTNGLPQDISDSDKEFVQDLLGAEQLQEGYIPVGEEGGEMYHIYVPARNNASSSDGRPNVVVWLTGGPGCSSELAFFTENGPVRLSTEGVLSRNEHSWSEAAHMVYVDQPLGTGFSQAGSWLDYSTSEKKIALFIREFLVKFFDIHKELRGRLFIAGESYAGHYIPFLAAYLVKEPVPDVELAGIALGNAWVDPINQFASLPEFSYVSGMIDSDGYKAAAEGMETCKILINRHELTIAFIECNLVASTLIGRLNPYDIRLECEPNEITCYNSTALTQFMLRPDVLQLLGAKTNWTMCDPIVRQVLMSDWVRSFRDHVGVVLNNDIPVLVYSGDKDFLCNWIGSLEWTSCINWKRQENFIASELVPWHVGAVKAGEVKNAGPLTFLKIHDAGHMAPMDKPRETLKMLEQFIAKGSLDSHIDEPVRSNRHDEGSESAVAAAGKSKDEMPLKVFEDMIVVQ